MHVIIDTYKNELINCQVILTTILKRNSQIRIWVKIDDEEEG